VPLAFLYGERACARHRSRSVRARIDQSWESLRPTLVEQDQVDRPEFRPRQTASIGLPGPALAQTKWR
jgi:hypothetical protein